MKHNQRDWRSLVDLFTKSSISLKGFCSEHKLSPSTFRYHVEKYSKESPCEKRTKSKKFYPLISLPPESTEGGGRKEIILELPHGIRLEIRA